MINWFKEIRSLWIGDIIKRKKETPFIIFVFFLFAFIGSRIVVFAFPGWNFFWLFTDTYHIHHYYTGFVLLLISGWISFITDSVYLKRIAAGLYGLGFGLVIDEIGLLLTCGTAGLTCDYYARITYDITTYIVVGFLLIIYFGPFWKVFHNKILKRLHKILKK